MVGWGEAGWAVVVVQEVAGLGVEAAAVAVWAEAGWEGAG